MEKRAEAREHILVCISPSPSNPTVIMAAVKMAEAFQATLTGIYVRPARYDQMPEKDRARLQTNLKFARSQGASIATVAGDNVSLQIAEYAHISGATKIVVGRSGARRRHFWSPTPLTEQIIVNAPDVDVYIIPDSAADLRQQSRKISLAGQMQPTWRDSLLTILLLLTALGVGWVFTLFGFSKSNIITVLILGVLIISVVTVSPLYGAVGSLASVLLFNWFFIEPRFSFHTYEPEYAVTFGIMLISSLITGTLANQLKQNARQAAREAFRTKVLLDTSQLLQKADKAEAVTRITARQIITLLDRNVIIYPCSDEGNLEEGLRVENHRPIEEESFTDENEREIVGWVFENLRAAGLQMEDYGSALAQYHPISLNSRCYGVIVLRLNGRPLEAFENSVFMSILGECALALENLRNAREKEQASVMARNEQLRANLLRSISHDIRTPLTSISGNASNLISHYRQLDEDTLQQIFSDIYDDSEWLVGLVENLLSISRIENGRMDLHLSLDVLGDVVEEALRHVDKNISRHILTVVDSEDIILVNMDPGLIMQVIINLVNNAVKNTPDGSEITIRCRRKAAMAEVSVCDNGPGIPDDMKPRIFEMFYTGQTKIADGRRGLGLGLSLCRSIVEAHGGTISLADNHPGGACFTVSIPVEEVTIDE